ncbi:hypothetical protein HPB48_001801 [Haemaphysalis longicornis]|uniref:Uncharacterized protein n=1 Tax=Haemaphysalis longicornis TaxID=44386 RepID=A0A9J6G647_HAELO|nr:hypothetical protein HPB48_001801 [Haemaphysalis longicornis]
MSKKLTEWDRMMSTDKEHERAEHFKQLCKLSDEEVDLASKAVSKKKLREMIDVKIDYFDRLARASNAKLGSEGVRRFKEVVDSEVALAEAAGRKDVLLEEGEDSNERKLAQEGDEIIKNYQRKRSGEKEGSAGENRANIYSYGTYAAPTGMMPNMMPSTMPGVGDAAMFGMLSMQQRYRAPMGIQSPVMFGNVQAIFKQQPTAMPYIQQGQRLPLQDLAALSMNYGTAAYQHVPGTVLPYASGSFVAVVKGTKNALENQLGSDISEKLRFVDNLESAKRVLQKKSTGSDSSAAEEIRSRLQKINRLQMKAIDEIIEADGDQTSGAVSDLQLENFQRAEREGILKVPDTDGKEKRLRWAQSPNDSETVTVELTGFDEDNVRVSTASVLRLGGSNQATCNGTSELLPIEHRSCPRAIYAYPEDGRPQFPLPHVHHEHHAHIFTGEICHDHEEAPLPHEVDYKAPSAFRTSTYSVLPPHQLAPPLHLHHDGQYECDGMPFPASASEPNNLTDTVVIVNRGVTTSETSIANPVQPAQSAAVQVETIELATVLSQPQPLSSPQVTPPTEERREEGGENALDPRRFDTEFEHHLQSITDSLKEIVNSLGGSLSSEFSSDYQTRYADEYYDDEYSYDEEGNSSYYNAAHPSRKKGSPTTAPRRSAGASDDGQADQLVSRIQKLVREITQASNDVMAARRGIQRNKQNGQETMPSLFAAEDRLWGLIDLESQLADGLSEYRALHSASGSSPRHDSLTDAEDKLRRLIRVEKQVANRIGAWRQTSDRESPASTRYTDTTLGTAPGDVSSYGDSASVPPSGPFSPPFTPPSSSAGYTE